MAFRSNADPVEVIMCSWRRVANIDQILDALDKQVGVDAVRLWLINNNQADYPRLFELCKKSRIRLIVEFISSSMNLYPRARFLVASLLSSRFVITIDDDQLPKPSFLETLINEQEKLGENTCVGYYGRIFDHPDDYWACTKVGRSRPVDDPLVTVDYLATCGMSFPRRLLYNGLLFWGLSGNMRCEDLWFSICCKHVYGTSLYVSNEIQRELIKIEDKDPSVALHRAPGIRGEKNEIYKNRYRLIQSFAENTGVDMET